VPPLPEDPDEPLEPVEPLEPLEPVVPDVPEVPDVAAAVFVPILPVVVLITNTSLVVKSAFNPSINNEPVNPTLPVNSCLSVCASPNLLLPVA
jgi:hypothetical protein